MQTNNEALPFSDRRCLTSPHRPLSIPGQFDPDETLDTKRSAVVVLFQLPNGSMQEWNMLNWAKSIADVTCYISFLLVSLKTFFKVFFCFVFLFVLLSKKIKSFPICRRYHSHPGLGALTSQNPCLKIRIRRKKNMFPMTCEERKWGYSTVVTCCNQLLLFLDGFFIFHLLWSFWSSAWPNVAA